MLWSGRVDHILRLLTSELEENKESVKFEMGCSMTTMKTYATNHSALSDDNVVSVLSMHSSSTPMLMRSDVEGAASCLRVWSC